MSCPDGKHDLFAVNPFVHPTEKDIKGEPLEIIGAPPQSEEEPAWCRKCGALYSKKPILFGFGGGWGFRHHAADKDAPTLGNMMRESVRSKRIRAYLTMAAAVISARAFTPMSLPAEAEMAELQDELWQKMSELDRTMVEAQIEEIKKEWPSDA
jgi:hypothetical protein